MNIPMLSRLKARLSLGPSNAPMHQADYVEQRDRLETSIGGHDSGCWQTFAISVTIALAAVAAAVGLKPPDNVTVLLYGAMVMAVMAVAACIIALSATRAPVPGGTLTAASGTPGSHPSGVNRYRYCIDYLRAVNAYKENLKWTAAACVLLALTALVVAAVLGVISDPPEGGSLIIAITVISLTFLIMLLVVSLAAVRVVRSPKPSWREATSTGIIR